MVNLVVKLFVWNPWYALDIWKDIYMFCLWFNCKFFLGIDLQNVNITLRILFRPVASELPKIYMSLGEDYDERVLPSITTEVLKAIVVSSFEFGKVEHFMTLSVGQISNSML